MRYHYEKPDMYNSRYGTTYICDHPVYSRCTLYLIGNRGLAVIQQRYDEEKKVTWWEEIDSALTDDIYTHPKFIDIFNERSGECENGLYPTITVRQLMWAMKMKPLKRERWETCFDRRSI